MIRNYFKTAWRNLLKHKFYSLLNIAGLTVGLAVGILILLWVEDERSYDQFHKNADHIYRLENMVGTGASRQIWQATAAPIGMLGKKEIPGVKEYTRVSSNYYFAKYKYQDKSFTQEHCFFADPSMFTVFDFNLLKGNPANPFPDNNSIVMTASAARRFFGDADPIGKVITTEDNSNFKVTGLIDDFPKNSTFRGDIFFPMSLHAQRLNAAGEKGYNFDVDFNEYNYATYLLLDKNISLKDLSARLRNIHLRIRPEDTDVDYLLMKIADMHLYKADGSNGGIETVRIFTVIALLILVIACINYVNLSTARSMLRAKEVSLRKIVGAAKAHLFLQFIVETALLFVLASLLAFGLMYVLLPFYNNLSGKQMVLDLSKPQLWVIMGITILGTLAVSSIYPAMLLSSFEPLKALKGKMSTTLKDALFRKALVITQFTFSIILIIGTLVISKQMKYIRSRELGFAKEHVFSFYMQDMTSHFDAVKADLMKEPSIRGITSASSHIVMMDGQSGDNEWDGKAPGETMMVHPMAIDPEFIPFFKMKLESGKNFNGTIGDSTHFILNETAVRNARLKDPIGKPFRLWKTKGTIIGVVKDFHFASMKDKIEPSVFYYAPEQDRRIYIKTTSDKAASAIAAAKKEWERYNAEYSFNYTFLDDTFNELYQGEERTSLLINVFAAIAILISCLGLFALAAYTAQIRTREIGVRNVLGASVPGVLRLLAMDFVKLVLIAIVIAIPVAWYTMNAWLQDFAYKTTIGWMVFAIAGLIAIMIAVITISFQSVKVALSNPVKSLRAE